MRCAARSLPCSTYSSPRCLASETTSLVFAFKVSVVSRTFSFKPVLLSGPSGGGALENCSFIACSFLRWVTYRNHGETSARLNIHAMRGAPLVRCADTGTPHQRNADVGWQRSYPERSSPTDSLP